MYKSPTLPLEGESIFNRLFVFHILKVRVFFNKMKVRDCFFSA